MWDNLKCITLYFNLSQPQNGSAATNILNTQAQNIEQPQIWPTNSKTRKTEFASHVNYKVFPS